MAILKFYFSATYKNPATYEGEYIALPPLFNPPVSPTHSSALGRDILAAIAMSRALAVNVSSRVALVRSASFAVGPGV